ncbi:YbjN domain-containing protein [Dapis sp. BLCC M172]|uniref:YbjN domain-containing protein n=1 Tax=Dapis sp. BLCC M172 TaxID=2975281 RepID=UPI003CF8DEFE
MGTLIQSVASLDHFQLWPNSNSPVYLQTATVTLIQQDEEIIECRLTFGVTPELYHRIDTEALFNLKPEVRTMLSNGHFQPQLDIHIEATLKPDLLPLLLQQAINAEEAAFYISNLSQKQASSPDSYTLPETDHPYTLLETENWLALSVVQHQNSGEIGYRTFWSYVNPQTLNRNSISSEELSENITRFFTDVLGGSLDSAMQEFADETVGKISNFFQELTLKSSPNPSIFQTVLNFFTEDDWPFTKIQGDSALRLAFQGKNGTWDCYAKVREPQQQFVFYSVCSVNKPENKRQAIGEFITRANYDMIIGNFEFDFTDGEIRYKTGIDVQGDRLSFALIKQMVYTNVMMMDQYLPGIQAVLSENLSPLEAITQIEAS